MFVIYHKPQLGDPTAAGNLPPCQAILDAIQKTILSPSPAAGYVCACGTPAARQAIADYHSMGELNVTPDQVIIANGCSGALELALTALLDEKTILLVPSPGFPLYKVICESHGAQVLKYRLKGDQWECDFEHLQQLCLKHGDKIRGLLINNPSNPTGAVFSWSHLNDIVQFCREHRLPIVADEIYGELTYGEHVFHPIAPIAAKEQVPVITASGLGKQFLVPGWRVGWLVFSDK
jgi:tyrosine aminotransferase